MSEIQAIRGSRTVFREEAIATYGAFWCLVEGVPTEVLGRSREGASYEWQDEESALAAARADRAKQASDTIRTKEAMLGMFGSMVSIFLAGIGLHRKTDEILKIVAEYRENIAQNRVILAEAPFWRPASNRLPVTMRIPTPLAVGRQVWQAAYAFPLRYGVEVREMRIIGAYVEAGLDFGDTQWDYRPVYLAETTGPSHYATKIWSFEYHRADESDPSVDQGAAETSTRIFLTREAACAHALEIASLMRNFAEDAEKSFGSHP